MHANLGTQGANLNGSSINYLSGPLWAHFLLADPAVAKMQIKSSQIQSTFSTEAAQKEQVPALHGIYVSFKLSEAVLLNHKDGSRPVYFRF